VQPASRKELLGAGLAGLFEAAGEDVPDDIAKAAKHVAKDDDVRTLLVRARKHPGVAKRLTHNEAVLASCRAMVRILDTYCEIVIGDQARRASGRLDNYGVGIDLEDNGGSGPVRIKEVHPGGPAQRAGLRPGDRIVAIDEKVLNNFSSFYAMLLLNTGGDDTRDVERKHMNLLDGQIPPKSIARISFEREGETRPRQATVDRCEFRTETVFGVQRRDDNSWDYWIDRERKIAHVRVGTLSEHTSEELRSVLSRLQEDSVRGLLLDLRWCPGGLLDQCRDVAGLFLKRDIVYSLQIRSKGPQDPAQVHHPSEEDGPFQSVPMIVLVSAETSGGGEVIAAALQDHKRAAIAGQRTRGKGSVQVMQPLPVNGTFLKITYFTLIRPSRKNLNRFPDCTAKDDWGVRPDPGLEFRVSPNLDRQLREWWMLQTLRPGPSRERLPLDDPANDPQRQFALQALRERIKE
jgi:C-terminal peptidase prc